ncbi:hypothetical protein JTB14_019063 [Gonioctena quinquepunctata]|nr:hypothetical protein JTB14_019063 [Gonioctena quinquepunctata]
MWSDTMITTSVCKTAKLISSQVPVYFYQFSYYGELGLSSNVVIPGTERVGHAQDLHYMWDNGTNSDLSQFPEEDRLTLHRFVRMWTNFVKYHSVDTPM